MALVNRGDDFFHANRAKFRQALLRKLLHILDRLLDLLPAAIRFRHNAGDPAAVAGDRDRLAALDGVEHLGEAGLCLGSRKFAAARTVASERGRLFGELAGTASFQAERLLTNRI